MDLPYETLAVLDVEPPQLTDVEPATGQPVSPFGTVAFSLIDDSGQLLHFAVYARMGFTTELVYDSEIGFAPNYRLFSTEEELDDGIRLSVRRTNLWLLPPHLQVVGRDSGGNLVVLDV
jgi:hypothetical protein